MVWREWRGARERLASFNLHSLSATRTHSPLPARSLAPTSRMWHSPHTQALSQSLEGLRRRGVRREPPLETTSAAAAAAQPRASPFSPRLSLPARHRAPTSHIQHEQAQARPVGGRQETQAPTSSRQQACYLPSLMKTRTPHPSSILTLTPPPSSLSPFRPQRLSIPYAQHKPRLCGKRACSLAPVLEWAKCDIKHISVNNIVLENDYEHNARRADNDGLLLAASPL